MKQSSYVLLICLVLVLMVMVPAVLAADGKFYVDGRCAVGARPGADGTYDNPVCVGSPPDYSQITNLPKDGTIVYIYTGGYCEIPVSDGVRGDSDCKQGIPPRTGSPVASALLWWLAGGAAVILVMFGLVLRRRATV